MAEKVPTSPSSIDGNAQQNNEQNASVGKTIEWTASKQANSGGQQLTTDEQRQKVREIYQQSKAIPSTDQSQPKLEDFRQRIIEQKQTEYKDAKAELSEMYRKPSTVSSSPSIS